MNSFCCCFEIKLIKKMKMTTTTTTGESESEAESAEIFSRNTVNSLSSWVCCKRTNKRERGGERERVGRASIMNRITSRVCACGHRNIGITSRRARSSVPAQAGSDDNREWEKENRRQERHITRIERKSTDEREKEYCKWDFFFFFVLFFPSVTATK